MVSIIRGKNRFCFSISSSSTTQFSFHILFYHSFFSVFSTTNGDEHNTNNNVCNMHKIEWQIGFIICRVVWPDGFCELCVYAQGMHFTTETPPHNTHWFATYFFFFCLLLLPCRAIYIYAYFYVSIVTTAENNSSSNSWFRLEWGKGSATTEQFNRIEKKIGSILMRTDTQQLYLLLIFVRIYMGFVCVCLAFWSNPKIINTNNWNKNIYFFSIGNEERASTHTHTIQWRHSNLLFIVYIYIYSNTFHIIRFVCYAPL